MNPGVAEVFVGTTFNCLAMTLEMPVKDYIHRPDPAKGWSPKRCGQLGRAILVAMSSSNILERLRREEE